MRRFLKFLKAAFLGTERPPTFGGRPFTPSAPAPDGDDTTINIGDARPGQRSKFDGMPPNLRRFHESLVRVASNARGVALGISYKDVSGNETLRRIRANEIYQSGENTYISAFCYERNDHRTFRLDRIGYVFDLDGEVFEAKPYFKALMDLNDNEQPITEQTPPASKPRDPRPGEQARKLTRPFIIVMVAIARSDGELHPAEVETIAQTCCDFAAEDGHTPTAEDRAALVKYIKRQYPNRETVETMMDTIESDSSESRFLDFMQALEDLVHADGVVDDAEKRLFENLTGDQF